MPAIEISPLQKPKNLEELADCIAKPVKLNMPNGGPVTVVYAGRNKKGVHTFVRKAPSIFPQGITEYSSHGDYISFKDGRISIDRTEMGYTTLFPNDPERGYERFSLHRVLLEIAGQWCKAQ